MYTDFLWIEHRSAGSGRSVFIPVFTFDLLGNPEQREVTFSVFFPHLQNGNTVSQPPLQSAMRSTDDTSSKRAKYQS